MVFILDKKPNGLSFEIFSPGTIIKLCPRVVFNVLQIVITMCNILKGKILISKDIVHIIIQETRFTFEKIGIFRILLFNHNIFLIISLEYGVKFKCLLDIKK